MSLNLKNPETHQLVRELAAITGQSMTEAVTEAVWGRLAQLRSKQQAGLADRLLAIGKDCSQRLKEPFLSINHADLLYDDLGLPK